MEGDARPDWRGKHIQPFSPQSLVKPNSPQGCAKEIFLHVHNFPLMTPPLPPPSTDAIPALVAADPVLAAIIQRVGPVITTAAQPAGIFDALVRSIIYQQLHGKAASAIHARVLALLPDTRPLSAAAFQALPDATLRGAGLSANKLLALRDLAARTLDGTVPTLAQAERLADAMLIERLTAVRGIGPWTVHMLLIFHLGRPDVLPTGDYAIRKAFSVHFRRGRTITPSALERHARRWAPFRSIASWYLWRSLDPEIAAAVSPAQV